MRLILNKEVIDKEGEEVRIETRLRPAPDLFPNDYRRIIRHLNQMVLMGQKHTAESRRLVRIALGKE